MGNDTFTHSKTVCLYTNSSPKAASAVRATEILKSTKFRVRCNFANFAILANSQN